MKNNPLLDKDFLTQLDQQKNKELYAKIISLTIDELPIEEITGKITGGSINIDGTSAIRRSCSVQLIAQDVNINDYYWGINTKFQLFIGVENNIDNQYEKIIWFKQGIFLITNFNTSLQLNGYNISIQGKDKMCLLNGDISGTINSLTVDFGKYDSIDSDGNIVRKDYLIKEIIKEAVHQYAGEPYNNIIIKDLDMTGLELIEYQGNENLYLIIKDDVVTNYKFAGDDDNNSYYLFIDKETEPTQQINIENLPVYDNRISRDFGEEFAAATQICTKTSYTTGAWTVARIQYGDTCGYRETELVYPNDLISNIGESITQSLLDKLVKMLGEYEYFYDIDGHFVFQRKMTYNDNSWNSIQNLSDADNLYVENAVYTSAMTYSFLDSNLITAFQNTPNITNLKNDFSIWGTKKVEDNEIPIHLRYAIDEKPKYYKSFSGRIYFTEDEYYAIQKQNELESTEPAIIINNKSRFKKTPLPQGLSDGWWEIDDWTRRYLYFADVDNVHTIDYYLNLSGEEVTNIISEYKDRSIDSIVENSFDYYVHYLATTLLGEFATEWATEDWLNIFSIPEGYTNRYYENIQSITQQNLDFWCWMFDTDLDENTGKEYIVSIEHGFSFSKPGVYPTQSTGCSHDFSFPYTDSWRKQANPNYHIYIYSPNIPDSLKDDTTFIEKDDTQEATVIDGINYFICDWREIIYQMAYDYYHYQHNDNYQSIVAQNNKNYYPDGITKYEQYYIDIYSFWRDLYNPNSEGINSHIVDMSLKSLYYWDGSNFEELSLNSEENVIISKPQDVVDEDGLFYYVSGKDKYTPYVVSSENNQYYLQSLYKDLSSIKYDPSKTYIKEDSNGNISICNNDIGYKRVFLTNSSYFGGYYYTQNENDYILDPIYKRIEFSENLKYLPNKYYIKVNEEFKIDNRKNQTNGEEYYIKNTFDQNKEYYEKSIYFTGGYKYYVGDEWQKVNNFGAGIQYYTQNYYQYVGNNNGNYNKNSITNIFEIDENNNGSYIKVNISGPNIEIGYEKEIYIDPEKEYYEFLSTSSLNIYSKVTAFLKGKRYYYYDNGQYIYDENIVFDNNKIYYKRFINNEQNQELVNLIDCNNLNYYYSENYSQGIISDTYSWDKDNKVFNGSVMYFYPGDIYYSYNLQEYSTLNNNYYFLKNQYYYLSTFSSFDSNIVYYFDTYGTIASITREEYQPNKYYIKGEDTDEMFTKRNILHEFKKGFDYFIIENENNKSLISEKKYLLATFYPSTNTIFYDLKDNNFIPISLSQTDFQNRNKNYYLAYGKYNYYCYTDKILNNLIFLQEPYDKNAIYYNNNDINLLKQSYVGQITEDKWFLNNYYTLCSTIKFQQSKEYIYEYEKQTDISEDNYEKNKYYYLDGEKYIFTGELEYDSSLEYYLQLPSAQIFYLTPSLNSKTIQYLDKESWLKTKYFELIQDKGIYLSNEFNIYNFWSSKIKNPENLIFWFDFLDISNGGDLAQYSAHNIGDRSKSINDKDVRSIYYRDIPTVIFKDNNSAYIKIFLNEDKFKAAEEDYFIYDEKNNCFVKVVAFDKTKNYYIIKQDGSSPRVGSENYYDTINMYLEDENILAIKYNPSIDYYRKWNYAEDGKTGYTYVNIISSLDNLFSISNQKKSTFDVLDNFLYNNSYCIETIQITAIPIYHLSPNTRILVRDDKTGINGEYIVSKISLPLTYNGTMNISATKAVKRIY